MEIEFQNHRCRCRPNFTYNNHLPFSLLYLFLFFLFIFWKVLKSNSKNYILGQRKFFLIFYNLIFWCIMSVEARVFSHLHATYQSNEEWSRSGLSLAKWGSIIFSQMIKSELKHIFNLQLLCQNIHLHTHVYIYMYVCIYMYMRRWWMPKGKVWNCQYTN